MNKFNMCKNYITKLYGMPVPKGAFYGKDKYGIWVVIKKEKYDYDVPTLELYRWNNETTGWVLTIERSETVNYICHCADRFDLWNIPVEFPKYTGLHTISARMNQNPYASTRKSYKTVSGDYYQNNWFKKEF